MSNKERTPLTPKLRFPEFRGAVAWKAISLKEASIPVTERVGERELTPVSISAGIGFVSQAEKFGRDISGNQYQLYTLARDGDFVYNKGNSLKFPEGCVYLLQGWVQVAAPNVFICFRLKDGYSNGFFQNCFEANAHGRELKRHITSGARSNGLLNISKDAFFGVEIPAPSWAEQQKIADCLSSLDELIAAQARKVEALKTHKKGLMQQLFLCEGETQPRLRFPEFRDAGEWEEKALGAMSKTTIGEFVIKTKQRPDAPYPVFNGGRSHTGFYDQYNNEGNKIVISARGANAGFVNIVKQRYWAGNSCYSVSLNDKNDCLDFVYWFMKQNERAFTEHQHAANIPAVSKGHVECFRIMLPSPEEQQRIADCLISLDNLITTSTQELETLKTHKKGLMQQLFPSEQDVAA